ncbi:MAG: acetolactate synthase small subunit [Holophagales bacterium]|nr:MAG: acetolactate synthase small subunit [Holophagales bacterium]
MRHTLVARVQDHPGVLVRVVSMFRRRAFNVESLSVGASETPGVSRMTFVVDTSRVPSRLVEANLRKLVPVLDVKDVTHVPSVVRELALIRVRCGEGERSQINDLISIFRARIVDVAADSVIVEITGDVEKVEGLVELLRPRGILEMVRTGKVAMARGGHRGAKSAAADEAESEGESEDETAARAAS